MHTDRGRMRSRNEDACLVDGELGLYAVADGMGGHPAGDVAARVAIEHLPRLVREALGDNAADGKDGVAAGVDGAEDGVEDALAEAVLALNEVVMAEASTSPDRTGMGSTLVLALVSGRTAHVAHAGDS